MYDTPVLKATTSSTSLQIPGDGSGGSLTIVDTIDIVSHFDHLTPVVDSLAGIALGQLAISLDGFWGTISSFPATAKSTSQGAFTVQLGANTLTLNAHGLTDTAAVQVSGALLPVGLKAGTTYFVVGAAANTIQLALAVGGAAIDLTSPGAGGFVDGATVTVTAVGFETLAVGDTLTQVAHGIANGTVVILRELQPGGGVPAPLLENKAYFVVTTAANTLQLSLTSGGAAINITGADRNVQLLTLSANRFSVDRWRKNTSVTNAVPAVGTNVLRIFPSGSVLAQANCVAICGINVQTAVTAAATLDLYGTGASPLSTFASVVGSLNGWDQYEWKLSTPFMFLVSNTTNLRAEILFKVL